MQLTRSALKELIRELLDEISEASGAGTAGSGVAKSGGKKSVGRGAKRGGSATGDTDGNLMRKRSHHRRRKHKKRIGLSTD